MQANIVAAGYTTCVGLVRRDRHDRVGRQQLQVRRRQRTAAAPRHQGADWDCDGNTSAQNWTVNSNGTLTIAGGCMDITGAKYTNGTLIELWTCNGGANQQCQRSNGEIVNPAPACAGRSGVEHHHGTQLILYTCNGGSNQKWPLP